MKRGRATTAQFRKAVEVGSVVTCTWNHGFGTKSRNYRVTEIRPADRSPFPAQGRELLMTSVDGPESNILARELNVGTTRLTLV